MLTSVSVCRRINLLSRHCSSFSQLKQILARIITHDASAHASSLAALVSFATTSPRGDVRFASLLFSHFANLCRTPFAYNSFIHGLVDANLPRVAFRVYLSMNRENLAPDEFTFPFVLKACSLLSAAETGRAVHGRILRLGFASDAFTGSGMVRMYAEFGKVDDARRLFDEIPEKDTVLNNSMIGGYVKCVDMGSARELFDNMSVKNVGTYNALLGGYAKFGCLDSACELFEEMAEKDVVSWNTIIGAHARLGYVNAATDFFSRAPHKNIATWSAIISGFAQSNRYINALDFFKDMLEIGLRPNQSTLVSVLSCCAHLGALDQGLWIHGYISRQGIELDDFLGSSLIDMYVKCGMLEAAILLFDSLEKTEVFPWNSMIYGFAMHGHCEDALKAFRQMERLKVRPNYVTFVSILCACSHAGLVKEGRELFIRMHQFYGNAPKIEHYTCMVDMLSRANLMEEALELIKSMPMEADVFVWGALLGGLRANGRERIVYEEDLAIKIANLVPKDSGSYVLVSNIYASIDQWDDSVRMRATMEGSGVKKNPGCSFIEVQGVIHEFLANGKSNEDLELVYDMLNMLHRAMNLDILT